MHLHNQLNSSTENWCRFMKSTKGKARVRPTTTVLATLLAGEGRYSLWTPGTVDWVPVD